MALNSWPVAADYDEAIQNPHLNFVDSELKGSEVVFDDYGSPEVRSGNFASVYMLRTPSRTVAVRCFLREVADTQERYAAISHDLLGLGLPYTVDFEFIPKGIKIKDGWFPVLKMDWCNGELLDDYIKRNLDNPVKLRRLGDKWYEMSVALRKEGIAHGDLQHGNIFVVEDELKLIDYDGMFVPRLAGRKSNERGLEHYQHPGRTDMHFGRYLDNFANWLIFTTLFALGEDKSLWRFVNIEDKHLIFSRKDLDKPGASEIFDVLKKHDDRTVRTYAVTIENLLQYEVEKVPEFSPDRPVLYPPSMYTAAPAPKRLADKSVTFVPIDEDKLKLLEAQKGGDRGNLYGERGGGDRGRLYDTESGAGGRSKDGNGDRGNLDRVSGGDRGKLYDQDGRGNLDRAGGGDRGNLMEAGKGDRGDLLRQTKKGVNPTYLIAGGAAVVCACIIGGAIFYTSQQSNSPQTILQRGAKSAVNGEYADARTQFAEIIKNDSVPAKVRSYAECLAALSYIKPAGVNGTKDDFDEALKHLEKARGLYPGNGEANYIEGRMYEEAGQLPKALKAYQAAAGQSAKFDKDLHRVQKLINGT